MKQRMQKITKEEDPRILKMPRCNQKLDSDKLNYMIRINKPSQLS
jgi:hypothetical protein